MTSPPAAEPVKKRLRPLYATGFIHSFVLWYSIEKLFMRSVGLNDYLITIATLVYIVVMMAANIPLGVLADRWSRKGVLYIATCALIGSSLVCGLSHGLAMYAAGVSVWGLFYAAYAGTYDSAVYDVVLEETGSAEAFARCYGRVQMFEATAFITSALFSVVVARYSLRLEYFLTIPFTCCAFATLRRFQEPGLHRTVPRPHLAAHLGRLVRGTTGSHVGWIVVALVANCVVMRLLIEFYQLWYLGLALPVIWYGPSCALMYSGVWSGGALANWLRGGRAALAAGFGTLAIACGLFVQDPRVVVGAQITTIFGVTVLNIVLARSLHDAMPSTIRAGVSSVVSTIGYGLFVPTALAFGLFSHGHGIFAASVFIVVPLGVMCLAVARGRRWAVRPAQQPRPVLWLGAHRPPAPVPGQRRERAAGCAPGTLIGTALGIVPGYAGPVLAYGGPKVNRVGEPVKSLESRANTHSGRSANTLFSAGATMSRP